MRRQIIARSMFALLAIAALPFGWICWRQFRGQESETDPLARLEHALAGGDAERALDLADRLLLDLPEESERRREIGVRARWGRVRALALSGESFEAIAEYAALAELEPMFASDTTDREVAVALIGCDPDLATQLVRAARTSKLTVSEIARLLP